MKYILTLLMLTAVLAPTPAIADRLLQDEAWSFLYEFPLSWQGSRVVSDGTYRITTGDASMLIPGSWKLVILDGAQQPLKQYFFEPSSMAVAGSFSLIVPIENRGAAAYIADGKEQRVATIDLRESRVCNDDAVCAVDAGERYGNCPTDCGGGGLSSSLAGAQTAAITQQSGLGERAGGLLLRVALGAAGVLLFIGITQILDSRRRS